MEIKGTTIYSEELFIKINKFNSQKIPKWFIPRIVLYIILIIIIIVVAGFLSSRETSDNLPEYIYDPDDGLYHLYESSDDEFSAESESSGELPFYLRIVPYVIVIFTLIILFVVSPRINAKQNKKFYGMENSFVFNDEGVTVFSTSPNSNSDNKMNYEFFHEVYETKDCFYFYLTKSSLYALLKKDIEENRSEDLRNLLISKIPAKKYKIK